MANSNKKYRILISGGGTGGHIFPALSIANALKKRLNAEILFVGAENRMEMERVPAAGYRIEGLPVAGFDRKKLWRNFGVLLKLRRSLAMARKIVKDFKPDIAIGVGGYCSGPTLKAAQKAGIPTLIQEQNSYAGVTNKLLAAKADKICVAYDGMERFFPTASIVKTGNPVRKDLTERSKDKIEAAASFGLNPDRPTLLVIGGSLGARTLNESLEAGLQRLTEAGIQVIWQTGKNFGDRAKKVAKGIKGTVVTQFITDMAAAYAAADVVVSRAGAGSISELEILGKPCILVPSPNVSEDHQTKNAKALADMGAAILIPDNEAADKLIDNVIGLMSDKEKRNEMSKKISELAIPNSDEIIADEVEKIIGSK
ncbi:MAG: undecaprenyldiphospho-muramoylpentapeptide beta-N-acetylglucosaminyltransferase [Bacteroidales bacterium]|nr:undecaprenyldiphospho-muramoylpentapeptide beta-N-acetylglucosaminyltransferase [Bacteroidales bacterium]MBD5205255.1 undecaprenyldiphospho-muramoylpentapeptide beta-N-acetylglucosaminyltransferase [Bacteroidales bacterium]MBD5224202.1 undecaprenyldiphospho-muramoylpentapeptide beta-N-acetylglucosaminyltransferase [Bacteroidales bacterium]MBD5301960.1 undecaprenyldiphospho-muramoylpentapeptide beta-N-acetylglucosaminyltransferase [Bacteroides sp.]